MQVGVAAGVGVVTDVGVAVGPDRCTNAAPAHIHTHTFLGVFPDTNLNIVRCFCFCLVGTILIFPWDESKEIKCDICEPRVK